jgi:uncharacterized protein YdhG (YjbR/CyaY superfamily)
VAVTGATVDEYIASLPEAVGEILTRIRLIVRTVAPDSEEVISYGIPTARRHGRNVVHFAAWTSQVSVYPVPVADGELARAIEAHRAGKGTLRFSLAEPMPYDLIEQVVTLLFDQRGSDQTR